MGILIPARIVEVLPGDHHRIGTSFSAISNPLVKPLLQGIKLRYCRFWVPRRIYHLNLRANNSDYDPRTQHVRYGVMSELYYPVAQPGNVYHQYCNFKQSSLFDYLQIAPVESNFSFVGNAANIDQLLKPVTSANYNSPNYSIQAFNAEPYLAYLDIARNYFADSATRFISFMGYSNESAEANRRPLPCVSSLTALDQYFDTVQNTPDTTPIVPYNFDANVGQGVEFTPFVFNDSKLMLYDGITPISTSSFNCKQFGASYNSLVVPINRPDRLSRLFDTKPLTSQNAVINPSEITISNLSFLTKLQKYLTRRFFGGSRYTDVMYSIFGQKVPHVDSPVLLDVFDYELGSELVASTNSTADQNPGVLGGFISTSGRFEAGRGSFKRKYAFNEAGYLVDLFYIMPRLFRTSYYPDYYPLNGGGDQVDFAMSQGNFIPDFNGIGWQQPSFIQLFRYANSTKTDSVNPLQQPGFCCEPSWQQYRTLPDVVTGAMNPLRSPDRSEGVGVLNAAYTVNSPLFVFTDRMFPYNVSLFYTTGSSFPVDQLNRFYLARFLFSDPRDLNYVFGTNTLQDNIFLVFNYAHQAKRQVTKRFTLSFN
ncbi:major capsid protein [Microvirus mar44]|uniref:Major capsid protein n=1 Tax=Microvirus mar44 TaxID=2851179 RepID=A0A8F5MKR2_9VIRU|nr:major capsid protein [Microvirus mar44]